MAAQEIIKPPRFPRERERLALKVQSRKGDVRTPQSQSHYFREQRSSRVKTYSALLLAPVLQSSAAAAPVEVPVRLELSLGGSIWGPTYTVEWKDGVLHYLERDDRRHETTANIVPTGAQWAAFRLALDACDVWSWRRTNSRHVDQREWRVAIAYRWRKIERSGYGPAPGRSSTGTGSTAEFEAFKKAVSALLGGRNFQ